MHEKGSGHVTAGGINYDKFYSYKFPFTIQSNNSELLIKVTV